MNVLLVCTGNTCRSPMAAAILERLGSDAGVNVRSAGVSAHEGYPATEEAARVAKSHGLSLDDHRTTPLTKDLLDWADHVLAMERHHKRVIERLGAAEKVTLLSEYGGLGEDVADPLGAGEEAYEAVFQELESYLENFLLTEQRPK
jgi:protein-tyrosine-phosphatase